MTETDGTRTRDRTDGTIGDVDPGHERRRRGGGRGVGHEIGASHDLEEAGEIETETETEAEIETDGRGGRGGSANAHRVENGIGHGEVCQHSGT